MKITRQIKTLLVPGRQELNLKTRIKQTTNKNIFLFAGGQEHPEQVQRSGGEATAYSGRPRLRLCIRDHFKLRPYVRLKAGPRFS